MHAYAILPCMRTCAHATMHGMFAHTQHNAMQCTHAHTHRTHICLYARKHAHACTHAHAHHAMDSMAQHCMAWRGTARHGGGQAMVELVRDGWLDRLDRLYHEPFLDSLLDDPVKGEWQLAVNGCSD